MLRVIVLHVAYSVTASYYQDWADAFSEHPRSRVAVLNLFGGIDRPVLREHLRSADLAVILHSGTGDSLDQVSKISNELLDRACPLVVFMGNEFNIPWYPFEERRAWLRSVAADIIATQLLEETSRWLYGDVNARILSVPHGLNPRVFQNVKPRRSRKIDIGSRSFPYPVYLGNRVRNELYARLGAANFRSGLNIDLSTTNRLDRAGWSAFLNDCRFTVATEAGSSHLQRDDVLALQIRAYIDQRRKGIVIRPNSLLRGTARRIPWALREKLYRLLPYIRIAHEALETDADLQNEIIDRFFAHLPPATHHGGCISSRHFDAMGCGTSQLLVEGRYNDLIEPGRHYIPIRADFSNLDDLLRQLADPDFGADIAAEASALAHERHTLRHRIDTVYAALET